MISDRGIVIVACGSTGKIAHLVAAAIENYTTCSVSTPFQELEPESLEFVVPKRAPQLPETRRERRSKARKRGNQIKTNLCHS